MRAGTCFLLSAISENGGIMVIFLIIGALAGISLGLLRFKVFVLVPATLFATVVIMVSGQGLRVVVLTVLGTVVSLQIGYIVGSVLRVMALEQLPARKTARYPL